MNAEEEMENIRIDSRLQLLQLNGDRPYFLKSNEQLLTLLRKKNEENKHLKPFTNRNNLVGFNAEEWRRQLELAKQSIVIEGAEKKPDEETGERFSRELVDQVKARSFKVSREEELSKFYAEHMIERDIIQAVQCEFRWDAVQDNEEGYDLLTEEWDLKTKKLNERMRLADAPLKKGNDRVNTHKEFISMGRKDKCEEIKRSQLIESVMKYSAQRNSHVDKNFGKLINRNNQHSTQVLKQPYEQSQILTKSIIDNEVFLQREIEVMNSEPVQLQISYENKKDSLRDWAEDLSGILRKENSAVLWQQILELVVRSYDDKEFVLGLDTFGKDFEQMVVKYGGYPQLVNILKKVYEVRTKQQVSENLLDEHIHLADTKNNMRLFKKGAHKIGSKYPLANPQDNKKCLEVLAHLEASHNYLVKLQIESMQRVNKNNIIINSQKSNIHMEGLSNKELNFVRSCRGFLERRLLEEEDSEHLQELIIPDNNNLPIFGIIYLLFISGEFDLTEKVMKEYSGSLKAQVNSTLLLFREWLTCYSECDRPEYFLQLGNLHKKRESLQTFKTNFSQSYNLITSDIFHLLFVKALFQESLDTLEDSKLVVNNYLDMLIFSWVNSLSFGLKSLRESGRDMKMFRQFLGKTVSFESEGILDFANELVSGLMFSEIEQSLVGNDKLASESIHIGLFLQEAGISDVLDLYRDVFFCNSSSIGESFEIDSNPKSKVILHRDFIYEKVFDFCGEIARQFPVETLLYLEIISPLTQKNVQSVLSKSNPNIGISEDMGNSSSGLNLSNQQDASGYLIPRVSSSGLILLSKLLNSLKLQSILTLLVRFDLLPSFFGLLREQLANINHFRAASSQMFFKDLLYLLCSRAESLKISRFLHARILEENQSYNELLFLFIEEQVDIIISLNPLLYESPKISEISGRITASKQLRSVQQDTREEANQILQKVCGLDSFNSTDREGSNNNIDRSYLERAFIVKIEEEIYSAHENYSEAIFLLTIRNGIHRFLSGESIESNMNYYVKRDLYKDMMIFSEKGAFCSLLFIEFKLQLITKYRLLLLENRRMRMRRGTVQLLEDQVAKIRKFYHENVLRVTIDIDSAKKCSEVQQSIDNLFNSLQMLD